jgi:hypothetical protein
MSVIVNGHKFPGDTKRDICFYCGTLLWEADQRDCKGTVEVESRPVITVSRDMNPAGGISTPVENHRLNMFIRRSIEANDKIVVRVFDNACGVCHVSSFDIQTGHRYMRDVAIPKL